MIWLLDLNYTLVANSHAKCKPMTRQIELEEYRQWLVEELQAAGGLVLLLTARPHMHRDQTLDSIRTKTGWEPDEAFFNTHNEPPPMAKERMLREMVLPAYGGNPQQYFGLESNPWTRAMYEAKGIRSCRVPDQLPIVRPWIECCQPAGGSSTQR